MTIACDADASLTSPVSILYQLWEGLIVCCSCNILIRVKFRCPPINSIEFNDDTRSTSFVSIAVCSMTRAQIGFIELVVVSFKEFIDFMNQWFVRARLPMIKLYDSSVMPLSCHRS